MNPEDPNDASIIESMIRAKQLDQERVVDMRGRERFGGPTPLMGGSREELLRNMPTNNQVAELAQMVAKLQLGRAPQPSQEVSPELAEMFRDLGRQISRPDLAQFKRPDRGVLAYERARKEPELHMPPEYYE